MKTLSDYCIELFGEKVYKISLDAGFTCPNRDGTLDTRGCIFCSAGGSGDFAQRRTESISKQIESAKKQVSGKYKGNKYIAYFQAFTNTYASTDILRRLFTEVINRADIAALSIATRPDCLPDDVMSLLSELNQIKPVWVELGLQTVKDESVRYIRRCYETQVYDDAVKRLREIGIHIVTHVILYLPGETKSDMLETVRHCVSAGTCGIKIQLLHVIAETDLEKDYNAGKFFLPSLEEYAVTVADCIEQLPDNIIIHRITGDGAKRSLIAPVWSGDKKRVLNTINRALRERNLL